MVTSNNANKPTIDDLRRRARNRLIGSALLVIGAIVLFSFLFDSKPRSPHQSGVDFSIPAEDGVRPIGTVEGQQQLQDLQSSDGAAQDWGADNGASIGAPSGVVAAGSTTDTTPNTGLSPDEEFVDVLSGDGAVVQSPAQPLDDDTLAADAKAREAAEQRRIAEAKAVKEAKRRAEQEAREAKAKAEALRREEQAAQAKEEARVQAILAGKKADAKAKAAKAEKEAKKASAAASQPKVATGGKFIVQFGSLKDAVRAEGVRADVQAKGISAYTQTATTDKGVYTRLRSGPYASKAEADAVAAKLKAMGHPVAVMKR